MLLFLNDETLQVLHMQAVMIRLIRVYVCKSKWCIHEVTEARRHGIPIICVVDADKQPPSSVISGYMADGYHWLFAEQVQPPLVPHHHRVMCRIEIGHQLHDARTRHEPRTHRSRNQARYPALLDARYADTERN